jgi:hypothetical protein
LELIVVQLLSNNSFARYGNASLVTWPIIGKPEIVTYTGDELRHTPRVAIEIIIVAHIEKNAEEIKRELTDCLYCYPLLGLDPKRKIAIKGNRQHCNLLSVELLQADPFQLIDFSNIYHKNALVQAQHLTGIEPLYSYILAEEIFPGKRRSFLVHAEIAIDEDVLKYLEQHRFVLWDLEQIFVDNPDDPRYLPHAVCLSTNKTWDPLQFLHITDLHVGKRYDDLIGVIRANLKSSVAQKMVEWYDEKVKPIISPGRDKPGALDLPIEQRFTNPNNMLRRLGRYANHLASQNALDFVVMTGDLIDFCIKPESAASFLDFDFPHTNWTTFLDILLNRPIEPRPGCQLFGIEPCEELLVPIFTVVGNHDYRATHYTIQSLGVYKKLRLKGYEAINYTDGSPALAPLLAPKGALQGYYQMINPYADFFLKFGNHTLVFLDSGPDSVKEIKFLLMADPSLIGFSNEQLNYLESLGQHIFHNPAEGYNMLFSHAPILNPMLKESISVGVLQKLRILPAYNIHDYKESRLRSIGERDPRSDDDLNYRSGTISNNWVQTLDFMTRYQSIAINGHTHKLREFRTVKGTTPSEVFTGYGKKEIHPFAIYWDDYSELFKADLSRFHTDRPLHFQTPSLGISHEELHLEPGAFRIIEIKKNRITRMDVDYLGDARFPDYWGLK